MPISTRREFLKTGAGLAGLAACGFPLSSLAAQVTQSTPLRLSFSTLGCPDWPFRKIMNFAAGHGYTGLEIRGIQREMDLTKCAEFSKANISSTLAQMREHKLVFVDLGSSAALHHADEATRKKNLDEAKRYVDLAQELHCPYIRVFPNELPKDQDRDATIELIIAGLRELGDYAKGSKVTVLMESHGELTYTRDLERIMREAEHKHVGLIWDIVNMWSVTKEPVKDVYAALGKYIRHAHLKDLVVKDGKERYVELGEGITPIFKAVDVLHANRYQGYYSFEWEKLWHPEIDEPEVAIAHYAKAMRAHFKATA